jgi:hypothetical protein
MKLIGEFLKERKEVGKSVDALVLGLSFFYIVLSSLSIITLWGKGAVMFAPDYVLFLLVAIATFLGRNKYAFLKDFGPAILLIFAYDAMRGYADEMAGAGAVNFNFPLQMDLLIGGGNLPNAIVQHAVDSNGFRPLFGIFTVVIYSLHFTAPLVFGFMLWLKSRGDYLKYMAAMVLLSYAALATFWLFPVAPPWMAGEKGLINIENQFTLLTKEYGLYFMPTIYQFVNANPVAAIPSLHFGYPFLAFLYAVLSRRKGLALFFGIYTLLVSVAVVYLGEHYVIDLVIGGIYAFAAMLIIQAGFSWLERGKKQVSAPAQTSSARLPESR